MVSVCCRALRVRGVTEDHRVREEMDICPE